MASTSRCLFLFSWSDASDADLLNCGPALEGVQLYHVVLASTNDGGLPHLIGRNRMPEGVSLNEPVYAGCVQCSSLTDFRRHAIYRHTEDFGKQKQKFQVETCKFTLPLLNHGQNP